MNALRHARSLGPALQHIGECGCAGHEIDSLFGPDALYDLRAAGVLVRGTGFRVRLNPSGLRRLAEVRALSVSDEEG